MITTHIKATMVPTSALMCPICQMEGLRMSTEYGTLYRHPKSNCSCPLDSTFHRMVIGEDGIVRVERVEFIP